VTSARCRTAAVAVISTLALSGCGSSSKPKSIGRNASVNRIPTTQFSVGVGVAAARISATLMASNHTPVVGMDWPYSVHVTDRRGHPLSGTVRIQFLRGGRIVGADAPLVHTLKNGHWSATLKFPSSAAGTMLTFQVVVRTGIGSVTLNWPVTVRS
jgi:hypothetical protein